MNELVDITIIFKININCITRTYLVAAVTARRATRGDLHFSAEDKLKIPKNQRDDNIQDVPVEIFLDFFDRKYF